MDEFQGVTYWMIEVNGSDDPPVWRDPSGRAIRDHCVPDSDTFSDFIAGWFASEYCHGSWLPPALRLSNPRGTPLIHSLKPYHDGLWLRTPAEPFAPPVIDFLTEQLGEPQRTPRPGDVTTYTFRPAGGTIRVTADEPGLAGGLSAWWLHAESPERLADLARLVLPFGTLRETLRADTDPAREVLRQVTAAG
jgi:hypothetical protein